MCCFFHRMHLTQYFSCRIHCSYKYHCTSFFHRRGFDAFYMNTYLNGILRTHDGIWWITSNWRSIYKIPGMHTKLIYTLSVYKCHKFQIVINNVPLSKFYVDVSRLISSTLANMYLTATLQWFRNCNWRFDKHHLTNENVKILWYIKLI